MSRRKNKPIEVERKYRARGRDWAPFVALCRSKSPGRELETMGPDTYFLRGDTAIRWRVGKDISQLTIKERLSKVSSLVRNEYEIDLAFPSPRAVIAFIKALGFEKLFRIRKQCHIFWYHSEQGNVCVVIYRVSCRGFKDRYFIEIEAEKGQDEKASRHLVKQWEKALGLSPDRRISRTLFEIYSKRVTAMAT